MTKSNKNSHDTKHLIEMATINMEWWVIRKAENAYRKALIIVCKRISVKGCMKTKKGGEKKGSKIA